MIKKELVKFGIVGFGNTFVGITVIYVLYGIFGCGYWLSSGIGYFLGSVWSYFMNKHFTFQYKGNGILSVAKFVVNVMVCYFVSYAIAKPVTLYVGTRLLPGISNKWIEEIALFVGMGIYIILNFIGQKYFCFRKLDDGKG